MMIAMIASTISKEMQIAALIQSGENTHHHVHAINPASFAITKMIVSTPESPILSIALALIYWLMASEGSPPLAGCHALT